jgi:hypothetical protein
MPRLQPCPECGRHVRTRITTCPHCDATLSSPTLSPRGAALGLALASTVACTGGTGATEPEYGVAYTPDDTSQHDDTGDTGDSGGEEGGEEGGEAGEEGGEAGETGEESGEAGEEGGEEGGTSGESDYGIAALPELGEAPSETD